MLEKLIQITQSIVFKGGSIGVFLATVLEEVIFFIPSPIIPMAAGFFLLSPQIQLAEAASQIFLRIAIPVGLGLTLGSLIPYYICYFGGRPAIEKWGHFIGLNWRNIEEMEKKFTSGYRDELIILVMRVLPIVPSVAISSFCGFVRYPIFRFMAITAFGATIRGFLLGLFGFYVGTAYLKYAQIISDMEKYLFALLGVIVVAAIIWLIRKKHRKNT